MEISDRTVDTLAMALNFRKLRQDIIASNIANAETPGYKAKRVDFEESLARAINIDGNQGMITENSKHFDVGSGGFNNVSPEIYNDPNGVVSQDGNTVDRDFEMSQMAENKILYDTSIQLLNKKLGLMKYAIQADN